MSEDPNEIETQDDQSKKERGEAATTIDDLRKRCNQSGMAEELQRDRREGDDAWNRKYGFPVNIWRDWSKIQD